MKNVFGKDYSYLYDVFYKNKNYRHECLYLEKIFKKFCRKRPKTILDLACGTGCHAIRLAKMGYRLSGIDRSRYMLKQAQLKAKEADLDIRYYHMNMENINLRKKFDAIISMFSAMSYLHTSGKVDKFLKNIKNHLKRDSLFVFDFWNADAVINYYSQYKKRKYPYKGLTVMRESKTMLYTATNKCRVDYKISILKDKKITKTFRESHLLRYCFIPEMIELLRRRGFKVLAVFPFLDSNRKIRKSDWDVVIVAKKFH